MAEGDKNIGTLMRVLDLSEVLAGPFASFLLAGMGAEIIKIEPPEWKRSLESRVSRRDDPVFIYASRGKKSVVLDITLPAGKEVFHALVRKSDVVLYNFSPSTVNRLGLHYDQLGKENPRIICCSITGYGIEGKDIDRPAFDLAIQAVSGIMSVTGEPGRPPVRAGAFIADLTAGIFASTGILGAYCLREKTGAGRQVDISLFESALSHLGSMAVNYYLNNIVPEPVGSSSMAGRRADCRAYKTVDGYVVVAAGRGDDKWKEFCRALGKEDIGSDPRFKTHQDRMDPEKLAILERIFEPVVKTKSMQEWMDIFSKADIPCAPINTLDKALAKAEALGRGVVKPVKLTNGGETMAPVSPVRISGLDVALDTIPRFGEHTAEILHNVLNYSEERVRELAKQKVIFSGEDIKL